MIATLFIIMIWADVLFPYKMAYGIWQDHA